MDPENQLSEAGGPKITGPKGFTLLELLLAISILAVVLAMAAGGLGLSYRAWSKGGERMERLDRLRVVTGLISQEVASTFTFSEGSPLAKQVAFIGREDSLSLVATNPATGTKEVMLYVDNDPATPESGLMLRQDIVPNGSLFSSKKGRLSQLDAEVASLKIRYYYEKQLSDGSVAGEWLTSWSPESLESSVEPSKLPLPKAVEITLVSGNEKGSSSYPLGVILIRQGRELSQLRQRQAIPGR